MLGKPNQLLPKSDNVQKKQPLNQMRKIDGAEISRDKIVIGITEKDGQDLGPKIPITATQRPIWQEESRGRKRQAVQMT
jgi:hypothetical protein